MEFYEMALHPPKRSLFRILGSFIRKRSHLIAIFGSILTSSICSFQNFVISSSPVAQRPVRNPKVDLLWQFWISNEINRIFCDYVSFYILTYLFYESISPRSSDMERVTFCFAHPERFLSYFCMTCIYLPAYAQVTVFHPKL